MKFFDIGATVEKAVRGIAAYDLDFLTVHGDPQVVRAAKEGASGKDLKILAVTILTSNDRADLDANLNRARRHGRDRGGRAPPAPSRPGPTASSPPRTRPH